MNSTSRRFVLRDGTWTIHQQLDAAIGPLTSLAAYKRYLASILALRGGVESCFQHISWPDFFEGWHPTTLLPVLNQDARDMAISPDVFSSVALPATISALMGMIYVVEGASLGAQILVKQASLLGLGEEFGARHLFVQSGSLDNWKVFLSLLDKTPAFDKEQAVDSAKNLFCYALDAVKKVDAQQGLLHG